MTVTCHFFLNAGVYLLLDWRQTERAKNEKIIQTGWLWWELSVSRTLQLSTVPFLQPFKWTPVNCTSSKTTCVILSLSPSLFLLKYNMDRLLTHQYTFSWMFLMFLKSVLCELTSPPSLWSSNGQRTYIPPMLYQCYQYQHQCLCLPMYSISSMTVVINR